MKDKPDLQGSAPQLVSLMDQLRLLIEQARMYELVIPADNYPARAAIAVLGEMGQKALREAEALAETLSPQINQQHPFTMREAQVLELVAQGCTNREAARQLNISERTVQFHLNAIFNKTGTYSRTEVVALAIQKQWVTLPDREK